MTTRALSYRRLTSPDDTCKDAEVGIYRGKETPVLYRFLKPNRLRL